MRDVLLRIVIGILVIGTVLLLNGCTVVIVHPSPPVATSAPARPLINPCGVVNCNSPDTRRIV